ncbi:MAG: hypothetical protein E6I68_07740 [Chloroflexi bacterium]|nr:MAG: hypothetical protein E6I68_07740 [Chloroflexota bacterium]
MSEQLPPGRPGPLPPVRPDRTPPIRDPAAIFIAAATLFAIFINPQNVGVILMLGVIALLLEIRLRRGD